MALGVPGFVRIGAAIAGCALVAACTPDPGPATTPTPAPPSTVSATPSATPTETEIERQQRLDFEAAEKAYRANVSEQDRLAQKGLAQSTSILERTSSRKYLSFSVDGLKNIRRRGWRAVGAVEIVGVARGGWKTDRLHLIACEDGSRVKFLDARNKDVTPAGLRRIFVQDYTVMRDGKLWKLSDLDSKRVKSFEGAPCGS